MSSNQANPSNGSPHFSFFNTDPSAIPYPVVPKPRRDGTVGQGRPCEICSKLIGLGAQGSLYSYNLHVEACQKKRLKSTARQSDRAVSLPVTPANGIHQSASLSPLIVRELLNGFLSSAPSPTHSPTSFPQPSLVDYGSDGDTRPSTSARTIPVPLFDNSNPAILINPPSDDLLSPAIALYSLQSHSTPSFVCPGITVQWTPRTIWDRYPAPSVFRYVVNIPFGSSIFSARWN